MSTSNKTKWLYLQLTEWTRDGLIDQQTAQTIRHRYQDEPSSDKAWISFLLLSVAGLMIGLGVLLLLAWNWSYFDRPIQAAVSCLPWLLFSALLGWLLFSGRSFSPAFRECIVVCQSLATGAALALFGALYPSGGGLENLLLVWLLVQLPMVYLSWTWGASLIYLLVLLLWTDASLYSQGFWLFLLAWLPYAYHLLREVRMREGRPMTLLTLVWLLALTVLIGHGLAVQSHYPGFQLIANSLLYATLVGLGCCWLTPWLNRTDKPSLFRRPFELLGVISCIVLLMAYTFENSWQAVNRLCHAGIVDYFSVTSIGDHLMMGALALVWLGSAVQCVRNRDYLILPFIAAPLLTVPSYALIVAGVESWLPALIFNLYWTVVLCGSLIVYGIVRRRQWLMNFGFILLVVQILARFIAIDFGMLVTGATFIGIGVVFLVFNWSLFKKPANDTGQL